MTDEHSGAYYFDGQSAERHAAQVVFHTDRLDIIRTDGIPVDPWRYGDLRLLGQAHGYVSLLSASAGAAIDLQT